LNILIFHKKVLSGFCSFSFKENCLFIVSVFVFFTTLNYPNSGNCDDSESNSEDEGGTIVVPEIEVEGLASEKSDEEKYFTIAPLATVNLRDENNGAKVTIEDVLESTPSIRVRRFGDSNSPSFLSMRGADATHTLILLDDIPLNEAWAGLVDLSTIPSYLLDEIKVFRGSLPSVPATYYPGGVVSLETRKIPPGIHGEFFLKGGFFPFKDNGAKGEEASQDWKSPSENIRFGAMRKMEFTSSIMKGSLGLLTSGLVENSDGDFVYFNDNGTPYNNSDDFFAIRSNNSHTKIGSLLSLLYFLDEKSELKGNVFFFGSKSGVPGLDIIEAKKTSLRNEKLNFAISYSKYGVTEELPEFKTIFYLKQGMSNWFDPLGEVSNARHRTKSSTSGSGIILSGTRLLRENLKIQWGFNGGVENWHSKNLYSKESVEQNLYRFQLGSNFANLILIAGGKFAITGSLRSDFIGDKPADGFSDKIHSNRFFLSPSAGMSLKPWWWLNISFNVSWNTRPPTLMELFGDQGTLVGNASLKHESSLGWDFGAVVDFSKKLLFQTLSLELRFFESIYTNLIAFIQNSQRTMVAQNIGKAKIKGVELVGRIRFAETFGLNLGYTFLDPRDESKIEPYHGKMLPNRPRNDMFIETFVTKWGITVGYKMDFIEGGFIDRASLRPIVLRTIHTLSFRFSPGFLKGFVADFEIWNISNSITTTKLLKVGEESYEEKGAIMDVDGYPLPGLGIYFSLGFRK